MAEKAAVDAAAAAAVTDEKPAMEPPTNIGIPEVRMIAAPPGESLGFYLERHREVGGELD